MYYAVITKCGHTGFGTKYYIPVIFAVQAQCAKDAAKRARWLPRVKHNHKDAILAVQAIDTSEYNNLIYINNKDPYLLVHSVQEQRRIIPFCEMLNRLKIETTSNRQTCADKYVGKAIYFSGKTKIHHPHKHYRYTSDDISRVSRVSLK